MIEQTPAPTARSPADATAIPGVGDEPLLSGLRSNQAIPASGRMNHRVVALIIACALFMEHIDATVLTTALPSMARTFGVQPSEMSAALTAYLLALAIFIPISGHAADRVGAKTVFRLAIGVFVASSLLCGSARSLELMIAARFVQGMGGAMMMPVGRLLLLRSIDKRDTVSAMSWLIMPAMIGPMVGPPIGGVIVTCLDWRWIFWVNLPLGIFGIYLAGRFLPAGPDRMRGSFDVVGFLLSGATLSCLLLGLEAAAREHGLHAAAILLIGGTASSLVYVWHSRKVSHPVLDLSLMRVPTFRWAVIGGSLTRITQGAQPFLLPLMMQVAFGFSPAKSGAMTLATALGGFGMKGLAPLMLRRFGFRRCIMAMGVLGTISYAVCGLFRAGWPPAAMFGVMAVSGFLMSFQFTAYNTIAFDEIEPSRVSASTSLYSTLQQLMLSLGIGVAAATLQLSVFLHHRTELNVYDFNTAFWVVTAISFFSIFANASFDARAGAGLIR